MTIRIPFTIFIQYNLTHSTHTHTHTEVQHKTRIRSVLNNIHFQFNLRQR